VKIVLHNLLITAPAVVIVLFLHILFLSAGCEVVSECANECEMSMWPRYVVGVLPYEEMDVCKEVEITLAESDGFVVTNYDEEINICCNNDTRFPSAVICTPGTPYKNEQMGKPLWHVLAWHVLDRVRILVKELMVKSRTGRHMFGSEIWFNSKKARSKERRLCKDEPLPHRGDWSSSIENLKSSARHLANEVESTLLARSLAILLRPATIGVPPLLLSFSTQSVAYLCNLFSKRPIKGRCWSRLNTKRLPTSAECRSRSFSIRSWSSIWRRSLTEPAQRSTRFRFT
jgi:hypothetical protein